MGNINGGLKKIVKDFLYTDKL